MASLIATALEYIALGIFALWVLGYVTHLIPRLLARRIARQEKTWSRDTVEDDRLGLWLTLLPVPIAVLPCLIRLCLGIPAEYTWGILLITGIFIGAVLFRGIGPHLRYDDTGITLRASNGKEYLIPWHRVISVEWQIGKRRDRKWHPTKPHMPTVAIRYSTELFGKAITDVYFLDPTQMRGISRFLAAWDTRRPQNRDRSTHGS